jgi:hypothetical protein
MWEFIGGAIAGGAIMYYIQPPVKDFVTKMIAGAPSLYAKAEALRQRAENLIDAAKSKQQDNAAKLDK